MHAMDGARVGQGDRSRGRGHQQHPGRGDEQARRAGVQRAGANANAVKELVLTALLIGARNVVPAIRYVEKLDPKAADLEARVEDGKKQFGGIELPHRTLGIVGLGAIGGLVADTAIKLGMKAIGFDPRSPSTPRGACPRRCARRIRSTRSSSTPDFLTLHVPLLPVTRHLIDARRLALAKPGAVLLNFARDAIVDEEAVIAALRAQKLKAYITDFPSARLIGEPGVIALPHLGASTAEAEDNSAVMVVDQVREFLEQGTIVNAVNFPHVEMEREVPHRVAIANANVPNMLGQISSTMAGAGLNIHTMVNRSRGEMAYTLVDTDSPVADKVIASLAAIAGVLSVRNIPV
jgi:D-3-phosphoglycerate dehydrogenase